MNTARNGASHARGKAPPLDDLESARVAVRTARTRQRPAKQTLARLDPEWGESIHLAHESGEQGLDQFLGYVEARAPDRIKAFRRAMKAARDEPPSEAEPARNGVPPFDLGLMDTATFFAESYRLDWIAKGILVADQPCVFGGPQKSLKTSILIDLAISVASATPFLGRFDVDKAMPVALISGESGRAVIQANAKMVCAARCLPWESAAQVYWGFTLPQLCKVEHLDAIRRDIDRLKLKLVIVDPLYLALLAGNSDVDPKDMFQMGPLLESVAMACTNAGATPVLAHHFTKRRDDPFGPPDMGELAYAGIGQFMRQWMLTSRRERYNPESGVHKLHFNYGGSAGHAGELYLDIETGRMVGDDILVGRQWSVTVWTPAESIATRAEQEKAIREAKVAQKLEESEARSAATLQARVGKVVEAIRWLVARGEVATRSKIAGKANLSNSHAWGALLEAEAQERVEHYPTKVPNGRGERDAVAYRMVIPKKGGRRDAS